MKIAVVSPHRGDAACALGLAVGSWLQQGHAVEIVNVFTRSAHAPFSDVDSLHPNDRPSFASAVRRREDEAWIKLYVGQLGRGKLALTDLNLKDAALRLHTTPEEARSRPADLTEKIVSKLTHALQHSRADALVLPLALGDDLDHRTVREACLPADRVASPFAFYEELPEAVAEPEAVAATVQAASLLAGVPLSAAFATVPLEGTELDEAARRKQRFALCYDSQFDDATTLQIAGFSRSYQGRERLWVNAAWSHLWPSA